MTNPPILVITGLDGYFILNFLQKSGYNTTNICFVQEKEKALLNFLLYLVFSYARQCRLGYFYKIKRFGFHKMNYQTSFSNKTVQLSRFKMP